MLVLDCEYELVGAALGVSEPSRTDCGLLSVSKSDAENVPLTKLSLLEVRTLVLLASRRPRSGLDRRTLEFPATVSIFFKSLTRIVESLLDIPEAPSAARLLE
jgi:hypothetical protein